MAEVGLIGMPSAINRVPSAVPTHTFGLAGAPTEVG
jgi:hypothetical protein